MLEDIKLTNLESLIFTFLKDGIPKSRIEIRGHLEDDLISNTSISMAILKINRKIEHKGYKIISTIPGKKTGKRLFYILVRLVSSTDDT